MSQWFCRIVQCISSNNSPGSLGRTHEMLEMARIHCTSPIGSAESYNVSVPTVRLGHRVGHMKHWKWRGYTVQVQAVLPTISSSSTSGSPGRTHEILEMAGIHNSSPGSPGRTHEILEMVGIHCTRPSSSVESYNVSVSTVRLATLLRGSAETDHLDASSPELLPFPNQMRVYIVTQYSSCTNAS
jgi:hypothetical protein